VCEMDDTHLQNAERFMQDRMSDLEIKRQFEADSGQQHRTPESRWDEVRGDYDRMRKALGRELRSRGLAPIETTRAPR
jgi:hypothetical protein